jgi:glutamate synthase domain-containing protein 3
MILSESTFYLSAYTMFDRELTEAEKRLESKYDAEIKQQMSDYSFTLGYRSSDRWWEYCDPRGAGGIRIGFNGCPGNNIGDSESWDVGGFSNVFKG